MLKFTQIFFSAIAKFKLSILIFKFNIFTAVKVGLSGDFHIFIIKSYTFTLDLAIV